MPESSLRRDIEATSRPADQATIPPPTLKESALIFARGVFMGAADIVPGVSGGTVALITGIYDRLVFGIRNIRFRFVIDLLRGRTKEAGEDFRRIDFALFIPLVLGIAAAFATLSHGVGWLLENHPATTFAFFFGLILASAFVVFRRTGRPTPAALVLALAGGGGAAWFVGLDVLEAAHSLPVVFGSAFVAICAMILPGISGAFVLLLLNQYEYMIEVLRDPRWTVLLVFTAGAALGLLAFSRILAWLLRRYRTPVLYFLVGLMVGSLRKPFLEMQAAERADPLWLLGILTLAGFALVYLLDVKLGGKRERAV